MLTITRDPDSGVVDQVCEPLRANDVWDAAVFAVRWEQSFMGRPHTYWKALVCDTAQRLADEASPEQYDDWGISNYE